MSGKKNSDWLDWLKGESPLLPASEIEYIAEFRSRIIQEAKSSKTYHDDKLSEFKLSILKDNFKQVVDYLRKNTKSKETFLELYPGWCTVRDASIRQLKFIANTIETDRKNCIGARNVGHVTTLVGGMVCLATGGWFIRLLGTGLMALGTLGNAGISEKEESSLRREIEKAKKIIKEDQEYSQKVWNWLSDGSHVQKALNSINSINVDEKSKKAACKLQNLFQNCDQTQLEKSLMNSRIKNIMVELSPRLAKDVADIVGILIATSKLLKIYSHVFEKLLCFKQLDHVVEDLACCVFGANSLALAKCSPLTSIQKFSIGIAMALNVISILSSTEDMNSVSKEALQIKETADKLKEEAKMFEGLYYKLVDNIR